MNSRVIVEKIEKILYECDRHINRIESSSKKMSAFMPLDKEKYINLSDDEVEHIDQFLFRFAKLQDAMGQKLFRAILIYLNEDIEGKPFIDILNTMEKIGLIDSAYAWRELRDIRNELSHNYEDEPEQMSEAINKIYDKRSSLINIYKKIKSYYQKKNNLGY